MKSLTVLTVGAVMALGLMAGSAHADMMMKDKAMMKGDAMTDGAMMMADDAKADVAISGYCPVCVIHGMKNKGSDNFVTEYQGKIYKFPSIKQQKMFVENPEEYTKDLDMKFNQLKDK